MDPILFTIVILAIVFLSTLARSLFGFGNALVAMPLLAMTVGMQIATPLVALLASTMSLAILLESWRSVHLESAWRLVASSLLGIPIGLVLLKGTHEGVVKILLALLIISYSLYNLLGSTPSRSIFARRGSKPDRSTAARERPGPDRGSVDIPPEQYWLDRECLTLPVLTDDRSAYVFGLLAGILGGAYNTNGPPVVIYGTLRKWPAQSFRATLQGYFLPTGILTALGHGLAGLWTSSVLHFYAISLPVVFLAVLVGSRLNRSIPQGKFDQYVHAFLIAIGTMLLINSIRT